MTVAQRRQSRIRPLRAHHRRRRLELESDLCRGRRETAMDGGDGSGPARLRRRARPLPVLGGRAADRARPAGPCDGSRSASTSPTRCTDQMEQGLKRAAITGPISQAIFLPIVMAIEAGILVVIFSLLMGGAATFKHVFAVVTHSSVIVALQQIFSMTLSYVSGKAASANLGIFVPMLEETASSRSFSGPSICFWCGRRSTWRSAWVCCTSGARVRSPGHAGTVRRYRVGDRVLSIGLLRRFDDPQKGSHYCCCRDRWRRRRGREPVLQARDRLERQRRGPPQRATSRPSSRRRAGSSRSVRSTCQRTRRAG